MLIPMQSNGRTKMVTLATFIKEIRKDRGLTQEELATRSEVSRLTITYIEGGQIPTLDVLGRILENLGYRIAIQHVIE